MSPLMSPPALVPPPIWGGRQILPMCKWPRENPGEGKKYLPEKTFHAIYSV